MLLTLVVWGTLAGIVHFILIGILYGNPLVERISAKAEKESPAVKKWTSQPKYFLIQFLGTQVEVYILTLAFVWIRPLIALPPWEGWIVLGLLFSAIRIYPRFWNMWVQSTYPFRLLVVEFVNGTLGTLAITAFLQFFTQH